MKQIYNLIVLLACFFVTSCGKDTEPEQLAPSVELLELTDMSRTVVTLHGKLDAPDLNSIEEVGFKVGKASDLSDAQLYPAKDFKENLEDVSAEVRGLEVGGTYFYAMYVSNGISLSSSEIQAFTTLTNSPPYPSEVTKADSTRAYFTAKIVDNGGAPVTTKGFCWSTKTKPTIFDSFKVIESSGDDMEIVVPEMKSGITYYIRTFAENANGFTYSKEVKFQLPSPGIYKLKDLLAFRDAVNSGGSIDQWLDEEGTVNLFADIDLASVGNWIPINKIAQGVTFDGNGYALKNFTLHKIIPVGECETFGFIMKNYGCLRNLNIEAKIDTQNEPNNGRITDIGIICYASYGEILNCSSKSEANVLDGRMSGICMENIGLIQDCVSDGVCISSHGATGICCMNIGRVKRCVNKMMMSSRESAVLGAMGGIVGYNSDEISDCVNYGNIVMRWNGVMTYGVAGIVSRLHYGKVLNCRNEGIIDGNTGTETVGGIVGDATSVLSETTPFSRVVTGCKNVGAVKGGSSVGNICGSIGVNTTVSNNTYGGTVNGVPGTSENAVGTIENGGVFEP